MRDERGGARTLHVVHGERGGTGDLRDTDDRTLVTMVLGGSTAAFEQLHRRYVRVVEGIVWAEARNGADALDITQETFVLAWRRLGSLREPERFRAWLLQIARHAVIDHRRRIARRPVLDGDDELALDLTAAADVGPEDYTELRELAERLEVGLDGLSRRDATAITLAAQFGFGPTEIAEALGITPNNAKVVLHRARARLRAALR